MHWYLYLIECEGGKIYTGITNNVEERYAKHASGKGAKFTRANPPRALLTTVRYPDHSSAAKAEYAMKQLSAQEKRKFCEKRAQKKKKAAAKKAP